MKKRRARLSLENKDRWWGIREPVLREPPRDYKQGSKSAFEEDLSGVQIRQEGGQLDL